MSLPGLLVCHVKRMKVGLTLEQLYNVPKTFSNHDSIGNFRTSADYHYQTLRCNVDLLKMIQLGVTFADENGNVPKDACTWQFNFKFNLT